MLSLLQKSIWCVLTEETEERAEPLSFAKSPTCFRAIEKSPFLKKNRFFVGLSSRQEACSFAKEEQRDRLL